MRIEVSIPFQSQIVFQEGHFEIVGSSLLLEKIHDFRKQFGDQIQKWPLVSKPTLSEDILLNEFILKAKGETFVYNHEELCHCRMVPTEKVKNAVKAGCHQISEVSRTTLAGTGCGSCRSDIEAVIKAMLS